MKNTPIYLASIALTGTALAGEVVPMATPEPINKFSLGAEYLNMKLTQSEENYHGAPSKSGYRLNGSYKFNNDMALRVRYFNYDSGSFYNSVEDENVEAKLSSFDIDFLNDLSLGSWDGYWSLGFKSASFKEKIVNDTIDFKGYGVSLGLDLSRSLVGNFGIFAKGQTSLLYGEDTGNDIPSKNRNALVSELGAGAQYNFEQVLGCDGSVRLGYEAQFWNGVSDGDSENAGLSGLLVGLQVSF